MDRALVLACVLAGVATLGCDGRAPQTDEEILLRSPFAEKRDDAAWRLVRRVEDAVANGASEEELRPIIDAAVAALRDDDPDVRGSALMILDLVPIEWLRGHYERLLRSDDESVVATVADSMSSTRPALTREILPLAAEACGRDRCGRAVAVHACMNYEIAFGPVLGLLSDPEADVFRLVERFATGCWQRRKEWLLAIELAARNHDPRTRLLALRALVDDLCMPDIAARYIETDESPDVQTLWRRLPAARKRCAEDPTRASAKTPSGRGSVTP